MTAVGFAFFLGVADRGRLRRCCSRSACSSRASTSAVFVHMLLAYPDGRIDSPRLRKVLAVGYALVDRRAAAGAAVRRPEPARLRRLPDVGDLPRRPTRSSTTSLDAIDVRRIAVVLVGYVLYVLVQRWQAATRAAAARDGARAVVGHLPARRARRPAHHDGGRRAGRARERRRRCSGSLFFAADAVRLPVRAAALARRAGAARSPSCCAGWATAPDGTRLRELLVERARRPLAAGRLLARGLAPLGRRRRASPPSCPTTTTPRAPGRRSSARAARVGAIVHDRSLCEDAGAGRARSRPPPGLSIENERLQAQLRARVEELRASRARIVEAGTAERRRLERNLHDGAQQRLVALSLTHAARPGPAAQGPRRRRAAARRRPGGARAARSRSCASWRAASIPPCSRTAGCGRRSRRSPAARRCRSSSTARRRSGCPPPVEAAAYFVVAEALTNVVKYAQRLAGARLASRAATATRSSRSPTTASAAPIRAADRACAGSPIASPRSTGRSS